MVWCNPSPAPRTSYIILDTVLPICLLGCMWPAWISDLPCIFMQSSSQNDIFKLPSPVLEAVVCRKLHQCYNLLAGEGLSGSSVNDVCLLFILFSSKLLVKKSIIPRSNTIGLQLQLWIKHHCVISRWFSKRCCVHSVRVAAWLLYWLLLDPAYHSSFLVV